LSTPPAASFADGDLLAFADWVTERAEKETPKAPDDPERLFVAFVLDGEEYGLPIANVREVLRVAEISRVPQAPPHVRGVMNVRGKILPIVEIRTRLGLAPLVPSAGARVVVLEVEERTLGLLVDRATPVARIRSSAVESPSVDGAPMRAGCVAGVAREGDRRIVLLDPEKIVRAGGSR
jgi:purine-binding chemotaxis protein CheW